MISELDARIGYELEFMSLENEFELEGKSVLDSDEFEKEFEIKGLCKVTTDSCIGIGKGTTSLRGIGYLIAKGNIFSWNTTSLDINTNFRFKS
jgi:hypothetical protein